MILLCNFSYAKSSDMKINLASLSTQDPNETISVNQWVSMQLSEWVIVDVSGWINEWLSWSVNKSVSHWEIGGGGGGGT